MTIIRFNLTSALTEEQWTIFGNGKIYEVGTTPVFDNSSVQTTNSSISNLKFVWNEYLATVI